MQVNAHGNPRALTPVEQVSRVWKQTFSIVCRQSLLAVATAGLVMLAVLNFRQESKFQQPDDGVWWAEAMAALGSCQQGASPTALASASWHQGA